MKHWLNQHQQALRTVLRRFYGNFWSSLMMFSVMGVALCLPAILYVIVSNLNDLAGKVQSEPQISLFLRLDVQESTIKSLDAQLKAHPDVKSFHFVSKETAWEQLQQNETTTSVASNLTKNPLPDAFFIEPRDLDPLKVSQMISEMQGWDGVELAQADANWIKRLFSILELGKKATLVLAALLGFALIAITGNSIRLQIVTQREEIEVSKLIGATDHFIRRPFLYAGVLYGLGGGLAAIAILLAVLAIFNYSITEISALYASDFSLNLPDASMVSVLLIAAMALGWLGSLLAVNKSLAQFNFK